MTITSARKQEPFALQMRCQKLLFYRDNKSNLSKRVIHRQKNRNQIRGCHSLAKNSFFPQISICMKRISANAPIKINSTLEKQPTVHGFRDGSEQVKVMVGYSPRTVSRGQSSPRRGILEGSGSMGKGFPRYMNIINSTPEKLYTV